MTTEAGRRLLALSENPYLCLDADHWANEEHPTVASLIDAIEAEARASMFTQQEAEDMARKAVEAEYSRALAAEWAQRLISDAREQARAALLAELEAGVEGLRAMMPDEMPWNCGYDPSPLVGVPLGMHHCPECGLMVIAGMPHPTGSAAVLDLIRKAGKP